MKALIGYVQEDKTKPKKSAAVQVFFQVNFIFPQHLPILSLPTESNNSTLVFTQNVSLFHSNIDITPICLCLFEKNQE